MDGESKKTPSAMKLLDAVIGESPFFGSVSFGLIKRNELARSAKAFSTAKLVNLFNSEAGQSSKSFSDAEK